MELTEESKRLFLALYEDAPNWNGTPIVDISKEQRGNLADLKKKGLLSTFNDGGDQWVEFSESGRTLGKHLTGQGIK